MTSIPSDAQRPLSSDGGMTDDDVFSKPDPPGNESSAGNVTSLIVTDMELTNINVSKSPVVSGTISDNATFEMALDSAVNVNKESRHIAKQTVSQELAVKDGEDSLRDKRTQSKSRRTVTLSKTKSSSTSSVPRDEYLDNESNVESQPLGNSSQEQATRHHKRSVHGHSKSRRTTTLPGPTVLLTRLASDKELERPERESGADVKASSVNPECSSAEVVAGNGEVSGKTESSRASKSSSEQTVSTEVEEQTTEVFPKKVAAYMTKPGKIVYSTAQRRSTSAEPAVGKSRSKSRSVLPLQSKPRSKQPLVTTTIRSDSPSSAFSFDGTPKEDMICRPAAMLAARKKYISMDDSMVVSVLPRERAPMVRQRSLSANDNTYPHKVSDNEFASSPHGIMLVLHNGKRTKPRTARSKSVRYGTSETVSTPPAQRRNLDVPLTPYAKAPEQPSSSKDKDTDLECAGVDVVPESPVFTSTSVMQQPQLQIAQCLPQSAAEVPVPQSENKDRSARDEANIDKVFSYLFSYGYLFIYLCYNFFDCFIFTAL